MKTCLVTTTFSPTSDDLRFRLALKTCQMTIEAGYPIHIVDGSPDPAMREMLQNHGAIVEEQKEKGMGNSRRQCFRMGLDSGADIIVWLEPEKYPFVPLIKVCAEMIGEYDIVFPGRKSMKSYPEYQMRSEIIAMHHIGFLTGRPDIDWMMGPRVLSRKATELLMAYDGLLGDTWHILVVPVIHAIANGWKIGSRLVDYIHPPEQTVAEEGDAEMDRKRDHQRKVLEDVVAAEVKRLGIKSLS